MLVMAKTHLLLDKGMKRLGKVRRAEGDYQKKFVWVRISNHSVSCGFNI